MRGRITVCWQYNKFSKTPGTTSSIRVSFYLKYSSRSTNSGPMQQVSLEASITQSQPLSRFSNCYKELVNSISIFISLHPLSVVEGNGFKSLMKLAVLHFAIQSRKHFLQSVILSLYVQLRTRIETSLRQAE